MLHVVLNAGTSLGEGGICPWFFWGKGKTLCKKEKEEGRGKKGKKETQLQHRLTVFAETDYTNIGSDPEGDKNPTFNSWGTPCTVVPHMGKKMFMHEDEKFLSSLFCPSWKKLKWRRWLNACVSNYLAVEHQYLHMYMHLRLVQIHVYNCICCSKDASVLLLDMTMRTKSSVSTLVTFCTLLQVFENRY